MRGLWLWTVTLFSFGLFLRGEEPLRLKMRHLRLPPNYQGKLTLFFLPNWPIRLVYAGKAHDQNFKCLCLIKVQNVRSRISLYKRFAREVFSVYRLLFCLMAHKPMLIWSESVEVLPLTQPNNIALIVCI